MKIYTFFIVASLLFTTSLECQTVIKFQRTFKAINASQIRPNDSTLFDLNNKQELFNFLKEQILQNKRVIGFDKESDTTIFNTFLKDSLKHSAIIFIRHGFDARALTSNLNKNDLKKITDSTAYYDSSIVSVIKAITRIDSQFPVLKYKNKLSSLDYKTIVNTFSDTNKVKFFLQDSVSIMANPDIRKLFTEIITEEKARLEKLKDYMIGYSATGKASFVETKEIIKTVLHKKDGKFSDYLLETKQIMIVVLGGSTDLQNGEVAIKNNKSFFAQSFDDLKSFISMNKGGSPSLPCKIIILEPSKIKPPSEILIKDSSIKEDISFTIHERNLASFQVGVVNNKFQLNNFSISGGNLLVKPDSTQKTNWKSNLYALIEIHIPRDIDNFAPIYNRIFKGVDSNRTFSRWLYDVTLSRIGIYGGFRISDDPLSSIHAGFNYAISKELYINLGWTWTNDVVPQVTKIGDITSLNDALKYARRKYSNGQFSWGLSFAPSALITSFGLKKEDKPKK